MPDVNQDRGYRILPVNDLVQRQKSCANITASLPQWFGVEAANRQYIENAALYPAIGATLLNEDTHSRNLVALMLYRDLYERKINLEMTEIYWLGILPDFHGRGMGRALITALREKTARPLIVETLDPAARDKNYLATYAFYKKMGFEIYDRFFYDPGNPMVRMISPHREIIDADKKNEGLKP